MADLNHVRVTIEVDTITGLSAFATRDDIPAGVFVAIARCTDGADQFRFKPRPPQAPVQIVADCTVITSRRVERGNADQVLGQCDQVIASFGDGARKVSAVFGLCHGPSIRVSEGTDNGVILKLHSAATKEPQCIAMLHPACYAKGRKMMERRSVELTSNVKVAVLIPCYNEAKPIGTVVADFRAALPAADIYVYDNNSTDGTAEAARAAGAIVRVETQQGKGNVVRRMFADIDADVYVMVDGDNTYEAKAAPALIDKLLDETLDMVSGCRVTEIQEAYRPGHRFGNWMLTGLVAGIFGKRTKDMLTGYRVFSRRFVKSFPALSRGFEIETELTVHALELRMPIADVDTAYVDRLPGSDSKLNTIRDGFRILKMIILLVKEERPFAFFGSVGVLLALLSLLLGAPVVVEFVETGLVPRFPTAILASAIMVIGVLSVITGLILDTVTLGRREMKRMAYLALPAPARR